MLKFLSIRDFVIVESLELDFSSASPHSPARPVGQVHPDRCLVAGAGERGDAGMVRNGCERAEISRVRHLRVAATASLLREQELQATRISAAAAHAGWQRTFARFINGSSATLQQMREAGTYLLDIHGQHAHQSLLRAEAQRDLLDSHAGLSKDSEQVAARHQAWQTLHRRRTQLEQNAEAVAAERELLAFQRRELEALNFAADEWETLQADHARLSHAASLLETAQFGVEVLSEVDNGLSGAVERAGGASARRAAIRCVAARYADILESAQNELQEAVYALRHYQEKLDAIRNSCAHRSSTSPT